MGRATGNPEVPACAFPRGMFSPGAWPFPGLWVTADMASNVYGKGTSTHNTRKGAWESESQGLRSAFWEGSLHLPQGRVTCQLTPLGKGMVSRG